MSVFRNAGNNKKYTDKYQLFRRLDNSEYEEHEQEPSAEFRACDVVNYYEEEVQDGNGSLRIIKHLAIETNALVNFHPGDNLSSLKDGSKWRISKATINDDNRDKEKSLLPKKTTTLELVG